MNQVVKKKRTFDGRFEILEIVGRGSCSVVYHACYLNDPSKELALKVLVDRKGSGARLREQLRKEALAMVSSRHRFVIRLDDFYSVGPLSYLTMELAPEGDLRAYVSKHQNRLPVIQAQRFLIQAAEALHFMHESGIVHRDIKPDNVLVMNKREIRLADFGVALLPGEKSSLLELQAGIGTMDYLAPEIIEGNNGDARADQYALGVTFYELLAGEHPFAGKPLAEMIKARQDQEIKPLTDLVADIPTNFAAVIMQAMSFKPQQRFASCRELIEALQSTAGANITTHSSQSLVAPRQASRKPLMPKNVDPTTTLGELQKQIKAATSTAKTKTVEFPQRPNENTNNTDAKEQKHLSTNKPLNKADAHTTTTAPQSTTSPIDKPTGADQPAETTTTPRSKRKTTKIKVADRSQGDHTITVSEPITASSPPPQPTIVADTKADVEEQEFAMDETTVLEFDRLVPKADNLDNPSQSRVADEHPLGAKTASSTNSWTEIKQLLNVFRERLQHLAPTALKVIVTAATLVIMLTLVLKYTTPTTKDAPQQDDTQVLLPSWDGEALSFPELPPGVYYGELSGFFKPPALPLTIVSMQGGQRLAFIVGLEGWSPAVVEVRDQQILPDGSRPVQLSSNGIMLEFSGAVKDSPGNEHSLKIAGTFTNRITQEKGLWEVEPMR